MPGAIFLFASFALFYKVVVLTPGPRWLSWSAIPCPGSVLSPHTEQIPGHCCGGVALNLHRGSSREGDLAVSPAGSGAPACLLPGAARAPGAGGPGLGPYDLVAWEGREYWSPPRVALGSLCAKGVRVRQGMRDQSRQRRGRWEEGVEPWGASRSAHPCSPASPLCWGRSSRENLPLEKNIKIRKHLCFFP